VEANCGPDEATETPSLALGIPHTVDHEIHIFPGHHSVIIMAITEKTYHEYLMYGYGGTPGTLQIPCTNSPICNSKVSATNEVRTLNGLRSFDSAGQTARSMLRPVVDGACF